MRATTLLSRLLGLKQTRVQSFGFDGVGLVADVVPTTTIPRCSGCGRRARKVKDRRERRWRHLDLAGMQLWLRYRLRRVDCHACGVVAELVPWAQHGAGFTLEFEQTIAYLAQRTDQTSVSTLLRIAWATVGRIVCRVTSRMLPADLLDGLTHIGVDELSYRRHHEYVTVVVDHRKARVVWVHTGKNADTLKQFFADLGPERAGKLEAVTIDMSGAYIQAVTEASPQAQIIFDRFHVQRLAHDALDKVRREQVRDLRDSDDIAGARAIKKTRFALQKNPWNLSLVEYEKLAEVQRVNRPLYRAYLLKETLAEILDGHYHRVADKKLDEWTAWASRSQLAPFQKLARTVRSHKEGILAYVTSGLSNGRVEGLNGRIRTLTRRAYGFHDASSLIGLIYLCCSGLDLTPAHKYPTRSFH